MAYSICLQSTIFPFPTLVWSKSLSWIHLLSFLLFYYSYFLSKFDLVAYSFQKPFPAHLLAFIIKHFSGASFFLDHHFMPFAGRSCVLLLLALQLAHYRSINKGWIRENDTKKVELTDSLLRKIWESEAEELMCVEAWESLLCLEN